MHSVKLRGAKSKLLPKIYVRTFCFSKKNQIFDEKIWKSLFFYHIGLVLHCAMPPDKIWRVKNQVKERLRLRAGGAEN